MSGQPKKIEEVQVADYADLLSKLAALVRDDPAGFYAYTVETPDGGLIVVDVGRQVHLKTTQPHAMLGHAINLRRDGLIKNGLIDADLAKLEAARKRSQPTAGPVQLQIPAGMPQPDPFQVPATMPQLDQRHPSAVLPQLDPLQFPATLPQPVELEPPAMPPMLDQLRLPVASPQPAQPGPAAALPEAASPQPESQFTRAAPRTGRNDPCPCGSGKKYKKCCGR